LRTTEKAVVVAFEGPLSAASANSSAAQFKTAARSDAIEQSSPSSPANAFSSALSSSSSSSAAPQSTNATDENVLLRQQLQALAAEVESLKRQQSSSSSSSAAAAAAAAPPSPLSKVRSAIASKTSVPLTPTDIAALQKVQIILRLHITEFD
jgi:hypothetical protein